MTTRVSRAQFIRGDLLNNKAPLRPPWACDEAHFISLCTQCKQCIQHCPQGILTAGAGRLPVVDFSRGECTFCGACVDHCDSHALWRRDSGAAPWILRALIADDCIAFDGVFCVSCKEQCEAGAIAFKRGRGGTPLPEIRHELCNGCGACYQPCPVGAIELHPYEGEAHRT